jgi:hypothetical protein
VSNLAVRRFLTVTFLLLMAVVLLLTSIGQPLPLPMPPSASDDRARTLAAYARELELEPADSLYSGLDEPEPYDLALRAALLPRHDYRKCQLVVVPSFQPAWAIYLSWEKDSAPRLVSRRMREHLGHAMTNRISGNGKKRSYSLGPEAQRAALQHLKIEVDTSEAVIAAETAVILEAVWSRMLTRVRYADTSWQGLDGIRYHASHWSQESGFRSGQTWSPLEGSRPYGLVQLSEQMNAFTRTPGTEAETRLRAAASALLSTLK